MIVCVLFLLMLLFLCVILYGIIIIVCLDIGIKLLNVISVIFFIIKYIFCILLFVRFVVDLIYKWIGLIGFIDGEVNKYFILYIICLKNILNVFKILFVENVLD